MIERVHQHIINELDTNTRTDTIFVITAIVLNLLTLGINSGIASQRGNSTSTIVMFAFVVLLIAVNVVAEAGLLRGKKTRTRLLNGLIRMYKDQGVEGYYDLALLGDYQTRYNLFILAVLCTGLVGLIVPLVLWAV